MSNEEVVKKLLREYGREKVLSYCRINAFKHLLISLENGIPAEETNEEESKWWLQRARELDLSSIKDY